MLVGPTEELAAIAGERRARSECLNDIVHQVHGGDRQLVGVEPRPGVARAAVDRGLQIELPDTLERAHEEGVDGNQAAGVRCLDMTLAELG